MTRPDPSRPLRSATVRAATTVKEDPTRAGHLLNAGDRLGRRYLLQSRLGTGGMSVVWRAWDEALHRPVAVKVLDAPLSSGLGDRELIRREARAAARIDHPHAMGVFDIGEAITSGGRLTTYVVMRLLDGVSLADRLDEGPMRWPEAVAVAVRIAEVLSAAHAAGVVHRDVTPENVMLTGEGAKLLDFGIAARVGERDDEVSSPLFGTPPYVAPERLNGAEAEGATDIYALGVLLFQMLTGHTPYPETTWEELEVARRPNRPPKPTGVLGLPRSVAKICRQCLVADPAVRPTAERLVTELGRKLNTDLPGHRRRVVLVATGSVATVAVTGAATVALALNHPDLLGRSRKQLDAAVTAPTTGNSGPGSPAPSSPPDASPSASPTSPSPSPAPSSPAPASASATPRSVSQVKTALFARLDQAVATGTIRGDVAIDLRQQVENLVNSQAGLTPSERHRQLEALRAGVRTRVRSHDMPESLGEELDADLVELDRAMDRAALTAR